uniref:Transmembrane protein n=1 Tax=Pseudo-nitzschia australis TaxID=44445 RepID=A0A7S4AL30_9STRA|mmetsp:Transcript_26069/g.57114  ORF Transcript_26069/g.57114 Transcript_26069/m.57114 type:complete len:220 (+) Transcript_26069:328-987(+)
MVCCGPSTCFTCKVQPISKDACMCGCAYLNGMGTMWTAQLFIFLGGLLSLATIANCSFVTVDDPISFDFKNGLQIEAKGMGFILFEKTDGSLSFCCSSQVKCCRYLNGILLTIILSTCQVCTFAVFGSSFCDRNGCSFSRGSGISIGAIVCYILAGIGFFLSRDYPGEGAKPVPGDDDDDEAAQNVTSDEVYPQNPELTPAEYAEAKQISARLGGTADY